MFINVEAAVFDLDDTLYPEEHYVISGFRHVAGILEDETGYPRLEAFRILSEDFKRGLRGRNFDELLVKSGLGERSDLVTRLVSAYRSHDPEITLPKKSIVVLKHLRAEGLKLGLVTDGYLDSQRMKVKRLGLETLLDAIVYTDVWGREYWKPHKRGFLEVANTLGVDTRKCVYIADNPEKDFAGAKACGMYAIQLRQWSRRSSEGMPDGYKPSIVVDKIEDIVRVLV